MRNMQQAAAAYNSGDWGKAEQLCRRLLQAHADYFDALNLLGAITAQTDRLDEAASLFGRAVAAQPNNAEAWSNRGVALQKLGRLTEAIENFDRAIAIQPDYAQAGNNRGNALAELKQLEAAVESYDRAIAIQPDYGEAHYNRGNTLKELQRFEAAIASFDRAIAIMPDCAEAYSNRGNAQAELKQFAAAVASYERAIEIAPDFAEACNNRGVALQDLRQLHAAIASYDGAIGIAPDYAEAHYNRGNALAELKQLDAAVASYHRAIAITPDYAAAYCNLGITLQELNQLDAAIASYDRAIAIKPDNADAYNSRGNALQKLQRLDEAVTSYEKAIEIQPDYEFIFGALLHARMRLCDWKSFTEDRRHLKMQIESHKMAAPSFPLLAIYDSLALQRLSAESWVNEKYPENTALGTIAKRIRPQKIRVGYFSPDFNKHAVALLTAELFESHDREKFEIYAFSFGRRNHDEMTQRLASTFDRFIDCKLKTDEEIAAMARGLNIDIAVDLGGHTHDSRMGIFAFRAAPIQVNYLGYPGTTGASYMDYIVADKNVIPEKFADGYTEKIAYLPSFQVNDSKKEISATVFTRQSFGLPDTGFVFCCFNNPYKITPDVFASWMQILQGVEGSVLWLLKDNSSVSRNLLSETEKRGLAPQRLVFAERMNLPDYLARYRTADLFLDTLPFNAGTTASDALWAGLPVLTCTGEAFAGRMGGSLLHAINLPELITNSRQEYVALAIELATDFQKLQAIKARLNKNRLTTLLFDTQAFARNIEAAYTQMVERHCAGLAPEHIHVDAAAID